MSNDHLCTGQPFCIICNQIAQQQAMAMLYPVEQVRMVSGLEHAALKAERDKLKAKAELGERLCDMLLAHAGETGVTEGAVDTLQRLIDERTWDSARAQNHASACSMVVTLADRCGDLAHELKEERARCRELERELEKVRRK